MCTSETVKFLIATRSAARFPCARMRLQVRNLLPLITLGRFCQACSVCEVPLRTAPFPLSCFFPRIELLDLPFLPFYIIPIGFLLQKLFQFGNVGISANSMKADDQFSGKSSISLVDRVLIIIINYKKYKKVLLSKRNYNVCAEF